MAALRFDSVVKTYGSLRAVDGLTLSVARGEILGLLGPNGAGKSTSMALAAGLLEPDSGTVSFSGGLPPTDRSARRRLGLAPQTLALYEELSATENLAFFGRLHGLRGPLLVERTRACLDLAGLSGVAKERVRTYSGGMKRRLNLAVAVMHEPEIVLLDEPTVGVDPQSRNVILERIRRLRDAGASVVYATHSMDEAQRLCDRVAIVDHGRVLATDTVAGLLAEHGGPGVIELTQGKERRRIETADPLSTLQQMSTTDASSFRYEPPNLETVFLNLTGHALRDEGTSGT